jgi:hypothetical protein
MKRTRLALCSLAPLFSVAMMSACSGSVPLGDNTGAGGTASNGPKIFVTSTGHLADFADDTTLAGTTVIEKADAFCNRDGNKPDDGTYKALLVDGVNRSANPPIDWVLQPSTTYYLSDGVRVVGTTTSAAIFDAEYTPLTNALGTTPADADPDDIDQVWTGIGNNIDFSTGNTCLGWTSDTNGTSSGSRGVSTQKTGDAFYSLGDYGCAYFQLYLYCVEQP